MTILMAGLSIRAQDVTYNWHEGIISANSITPYDVQVSKDGELFTLTNFVSLSPNLTAEYLNQTFTGVPNTATSGTRNFILAKSDLSGNFIWGVNSNMGDVDLGSSAMALTHDGGVFLALKVRHTNRNEQGDTLLRVKDANGTQTDIIWQYPGSWVYQGVILKLNSSGSLQWMKQVPVDYLANDTVGLTVDGFEFNAATADNSGNLYIGGGLYKTMHFGTDNIQTNIDSSRITFIAKLDNAGNYISQFKSGGTSAYDVINKLVYENNALYASGLIKGDDNHNTTFGSFSINASNQINIYAMKLGTDLSVNWAQLYPGIRETGQVIQLKSLSVRDGNFFLSGGVNGGIAFSSTGTTSDIVSNGNRLNGFVLKCNTSDGICTAGSVRSSTGIGIAYGTIASADSVFHFGYDWGATGHNIYIDSYDMNLVSGSQYGLLSGGGMATAWSMTAYEDTVVFATRCAKNNAVSFYGSSNTYTSAYNWGGLVTSYIFPGRTFTGPDTTSPTIPADLAGIPTDVTITLTWTVSSDNMGVTGYNVYVDDVFDQTVTATTATVAGLTPLTTYKLSVEAIDKAGNISGQADISITTLTDDIEAPATPADLAGTPTDETITLTWTASTDNYAVMGYNVYVDNIFNQTVTAATATITGLTPETTYGLAVEAFDAAGNTSPKAVISITTLERDIEAPTTPANLAGTPTEVTITLTWTASSDNVGVTGYNVYVNNVFNQTVTATTATITGLTSQTTYNLAVEAFDAEGNTSAKADIDVTTLSGTGIADYNADNTIRVYPNPSTDYIIVDVKTEGSILLYDMLGQQLLEVNSRQGKNHIDISFLSKGSYLLKTGSNVVKIIKQ